MSEPRISPHKITKPIQLLAVWFVGLIALVGALLTSAARIEQPPWICPLLVISAILLIPLFIILIFVLQTKFRTQVLDDKYYAEWLSRQEDMITQMQSQLTESTEALVNSSTSMKDMAEYGINRIYSNLSQALATLLNDIETETSEINFVGMTLHNILAQEGQHDFRQLIEQKAKLPGLRLRFLLTHPSMATFRERQEGRDRGVVEKEILHSVTVLRSIGVQASSIRFYMAPPTAAAIFTSRKMLFVPYSYSAPPSESVSFIVDNTNESPLYAIMRRTHLEGPWASAIAIELDEEQPDQMHKREAALLKEFIDPWAIDFPKVRRKDTCKEEE